MASPEATPIQPDSHTVPHLSAAPGPGGPTLSPGQVLAGRFRIVRRIAQGGMGEVWEAEDLEFVGERVAVKTIRPEIAGDEWAIARFRREIQLSKRVTHPNVCRVFDLFHHKIGDGPNRITFLTMELLPGETLATRIARQGPMRPAEALPLARQMAGALDAAHAAGVVHGDFKSSNVMIAGEGEAMRAVVTDFGLARGGRGEGGIADPESGNFGGGTPAYMAPEQVKGGKPSAAGDLYAFGVVLYEMVTGRLPFAGKTPFGAAIGDIPPPSPREIVPDLDPVWEQTLLRCLANHPRDRFGSASEVARELSRGAAGAGDGERTAEVAPAPRRRWRIASGVAALLLLALAGLGLWLHLHPSRPSSPLSPGNGRLAPRRSVAVLGFKNLSGRPDAAWLSVALSEMLATDLAAGGEIRVIPAETVARMKVDLALADFDTLARDTLTQIRGNLGSDLVVLGSYIALGKEAGGRIRLDLRLQDARTGETVAAIGRNGTEAGLFDLVGGAGADLRRNLGVGGRASAPGQALASFPANPEAARLYAEGLSRLRLFDAAAGRDLLSRAAQVSPGQPLVHAALSAALSDLGYEAQAREEAKRAFELSAGLPREERLAIEGRFREAAGEWPRATEIYRTLFGFFPDNLEYGLRLASSQVAAGQAEAAQATLAQLRQLPAPAAGDPRIDIAQAEALEARSDFAHEREAAERAAGKGAAQGARLLVARARILSGTAARNLGDLEAASGAFSEAQRAFAGAGDRAGVARAVNSLGIVAWQRGDLPAARQLYDEALAAFREIGDRRGAAQALNNIAILHWQEGDLKEAREIYGKVLAVYRETGNRRGLASSLSNLGMVQRAEGDLAAARRTHEEALTLRREIGERQGEAVSLNNLAQVLSDSGDLPGARDLYQKALGLFREVGDRRGAADALLNLGEVDWERGELETARRSYESALATKRAMGDRAGLATALSGLGDVHLSRGDRAAAEKSYGEALALREALGRKGGAARVRLGLAAAAFEGEPERPETLETPQKAEPLIRAALAAAREAEAAGVEAEGELLLARCLLARGQVAAAGEALARARERAGHDPDRHFRLGAAIVGARVAVAGGKTGEARTALGGAIAEARQGGLAGFELEAGLALGELELAAGERETGRTHLAAVQRQAQARGFAGIAGMAARAARAGR